jgi:hypothetical protein
MQLELIFRKYLQRDPGAIPKDNDENQATLGKARKAIPLTNLSVNYGQEIFIIDLVIFMVQINVTKCKK